MSEVASSGDFGPGVLAQRVADLLRTTTPQSAQVDDVMSLINRNLHLSPPASQQSSATDRSQFMNLDDPAAYTQFFAPTLRFPIFPNFPRRPSASSPNRNSKRGAWLWISRRAPEYLTDPSWANATLGNTLGHAYAKVLRRVGRCICPLYLTPPVVAGNFELWGIPRTRTVSLNKWEITPCWG